MFSWNKRTLFLVRKREQRLTVSKQTFPGPPPPPSPLLFQTGLPTLTSCHISSSVTEISQCYQTRPCPRGHHPPCQLSAPFGRKGNCHLFSHSLAGHNQGPRVESGGPSHCTSPAPTPGSLSDAVQKCPNFCFLIGTSRKAGALWTSWPKGERPLAGSEKRYSGTPSCNCSHRGSLG